MGQNSWSEDEDGAELMVRGCCCGSFAIQQRFWEKQGAAAVPPSLHPGPLLAVPAVPGAGDAAGPALPPSPGPSHPSYTV